VVAKLVYKGPFVENKFHYHHLVIGLEHMSVQKQGYDKTYVTKA
jgi:hypothetical protein